MSTVVFNSLKQPVLGSPQATLALISQGGEKRRMSTERPINKAVIVKGCTLSAKQLVLNSPVYMKVIKWTHKVLFIIKFM